MSVQGEGLGIYFMGAIFSDVDSLILYSGIHRKVGDYHRMLSKRFPFAVYYKLNGPVVEVCAYWIADRILKRRSEL